MPDVAIVGGGIAGLTAAHELAERGYAVRVYEKLSVLGGKARSFGKPGTATGGRRDLPGEHGFRFYPGFYKHVPHTMSRIPRAIGGGSVRDNLVVVPSCSLTFKNAPPITLSTSAQLPTTPMEWGVAISDLFAGAQVGLDPIDSLFFAERMLCAMASGEERRAEQYEKMSWADYIGVGDRGPAYKRVFSDGLARPLVAIDPGKINARTALIVMLQILQDMIGGGGADHILNGPTTEAWIDHWKSHLQTNLNVKLHTGATATAIVMQAGRIKHIEIKTATGTTNTTADHYVVAVPVEAMQKLLTPQVLAAAPELAGTLSLKTSWMTGLIYYLTNVVAGIDGHAIHADSPWALTSISELPFWAPLTGADFGAGNVGSVLSVIISNWEKAGVGTPKRAKDCTQAQIVAEVLHQLNQHLQHVPGGGPLSNNTILDTFLDPAIAFDGSGVVSGNSEPLLINTIDSFRLRPPAATSIPNLALAGDYIATGTNLATMESACEAGRMAARSVLKRHGYGGGPLPLIFKHKEPPIFEPVKAADDLIYPIGPPLCPSSLDDLVSFNSARLLK